ncbi:hypothetical protein EUA04_02480 [Mycolicibacterium obuense]|uniref:Uncharacterized protein n=1 Tax=Mycolicibacterium obuense TaxID=1807 RepID=A0A4R5XCH5_9MYCO|nr:hypothetical protein EUA04_02480 [Mycolicibacterium obuense]
MSTSYLALELAAAEHPGRWVGYMVAQLAVVGGVVWLVVWAVRKSRAPRYPRPPQQPFPGGYYQQPPPGQWPQQPPPPAYWPQQPPPPPGYWPPQQQPPGPWPQQPPPWLPAGGGTPPDRP